MYIKLLDVEKRIKKNLTYNINYCFYSKKIYCIYSNDEKFKDMFVRIISGLVKINNGIIDVNGQILSRQDSFPCKISIMLGEYLFDGNCTIFDYYECFSSINEKICFVKLLKKIGIDPCDGKRMRYYTDEIKKFVEITNTIARNSEVVIINNVFCNTDTFHTMKICDMLREEADKDKVVIATCDNLEKAKILTNNILSVNDEKKLVDSVT